MDNITEWVMEQQYNCCALLSVSWVLFHLAQLTLWFEREEKVKAVTRKALAVAKKSHSRIIASCESTKHQLTLAKVGDFPEKKGIGISPDPFGGCT